MRWKACLKQKGARVVLEAQIEFTLLEKKERMDTINQIIVEALRRSKKVGIILHPKTEDEMLVLPDCDRKLCEDIADALNSYFKREERRNADNKRYRF